NAIYTLSLHDALPIWAEAQALEELERRWLSAYDHCLAVSDRERDLFARFNPSAVTIPNGVEPLPEPGLPSAPAEHEPLRLLFVRSEEHTSELQSLAYL